jgi:bacteriorhodopsin
MMEQISSHNLVYVILLALSGIGFLILRNAWRNRVPEIFFWIHFFIVIWSSMMYLNLVFQTPVAPYAYYADWIISTPLIMLALGLTAMYPFIKINYSLLFAIMMTQAMIIATGFLAQLSGRDTAMLSFFTAGNALMLLIFYLVFGPLMECARSNKKLAYKYKNLALLLVLFWISYPLVWIIGTPGYALISPYATNVLFIVLPILCKPVFGIIDLYLLKSLDTEL